ncbi:MAG: DNA polymerase III subunit gamma/tau [Deltaproteobacteria bacterium]|nr:DNA polymerase III subunit gamma/tau [Deltaproteobacteria bacterium]MBT7716216.1 DNA polymerase III subunit gamma/tau [Deltaproteobacteria bacterium]
MIRISTQRLNIQTGIKDMSYLVLARKLRPPRFKDLVGQEHISKTLINAIRTDRVAHAFLFTGPRGTGKTSCARILTKALNCHAPVEHEPCNVCENCLEINQGIATDIIEIDAASNRGIEHIRELRENVKFSPAKCRFKTYIIDEVHMLTTESFNALLKTLEEPPSHVKFILATTDHHKIPTTVISRCQRYDFSNISIPEMVTYLQSVVEKEGISVSDSALKLISKSATGGMRDALTTLDMLISFGGDLVDDEKVITVLGLNEARELDGLLEAIIEKDVAQVISLFQNLVAKGRSIARIVIDLMGVVKDLSLVKSVPEGDLNWHDFLPDQLDLYKRLSAKVGIGTLQQYFQIILDIEGQIKRSTQAKICVEMGLMRMCSVESLVGVAEIITALRSAGKKKIPAIN